MEYNIYCDESSHLAHSKNPFMTLGYIGCKKGSASRINHDLREIKCKHNLNRQYELKWTKVSTAKLDYYCELIDYFYDRDDLFARIVIADKSKLNYAQYNLNHDDWYYRMYYLLLGKTLHEQDEYHIFIDIKDTNSGKKILKLQDVLSKSYYDFYRKMIKNVQHVKSNEVEIIQLTDLLIGAVAYKNNNLNGSEAKCEVAAYLCNKSQKTLLATTSLSERKLNLFKWEANYHG